MTLAAPSHDRILNIYLTLNQYPVLSSRIRARMRRELFERGIISREAFNAEAREKALQSQTREGLHDPYAEESSEIWELRLARIRDSLTDFYYAYNFPYEHFEDIIVKILAERSGNAPDLVTFNPELAPQEMIFDQALAIEKMPPEERGPLEARLQEIKVVLIRTMISDQLAYINIAKQWFRVKDLYGIRKRKIGEGKIGGKSAGMLLASRILAEVAPEPMRENFRTPNSYYLGSDVMYAFMSNNGLMRWADQKYKSEDEIREEYPTLEAEFLDGKFPEEIIEKLRDVVEKVGKQPLIVRSSSLLEDNFGHSFAGKYESYFCPNQGTPEENLAALTDNIARVYASALRAEPIIYRKKTGLLDYDERIAVLIQFVEGEAFGKYYLPHGAGVGFSRNLYRWSPDIKREDGFLRLVWGMGTRAVDQTGNDYPRLVALSRPLLHPAAKVKAIQRYSQQYVDAVDLEANEFITVPAKKLFNPRYAPLRYITQSVEDDYLSPLRTNLMDTEKLVVNFDELLRRTDFAENMKTALKILEEHYDAPVDTEFALKILEPRALRPKVEITLLQCRPQSHIKDEGAVQLPEKIPEENIIFSTRRMVPRGSIPRIDYVLFVSPAYFTIGSQAERMKLERSIGLLNAELEDTPYIAIGPGRWGTSTPDLGVHIGYADIYNTRALIELSGEGVGTAPEPSFGTHFFQDLMEANIYPLAIYLDDEDVRFNDNFFHHTPNRLPDWISADKKLMRCLRLIAVDDFRKGHYIKLVMDDEQGKAVAFLEKEEE